MSTTKGKPRIYFSSHPKDYVQYFETISDDILECGNNAIWFMEGEVSDRKMHEQDLKEMQLIVIPVTKKLLTEPNFSMDVEVPFAIKNHIPILPMMQETELEKLYWEKFEDLQYLNMSRAYYAISQYKEKLQNHLRMILVGEELENKIRAAFDSYIFLSYRKKDRRFAQELMRLIHKNEFCRDIAIWYDEFLIPGEKFNNEIRDALQKCDVFVLTVTPNLVNEENYITAIEYPMARENGKIILPVEMISTDGGLLEKKFIGIPGSINVYDRKKLVKVLEELSKTVLCRGKTKTPEHDFLIGLAYLRGIDVEVDCQKGVELITSAAELGVIEAMETLIVMYHIGYGVERNKEQKIFWHERKIVQRQIQYEKHHTVECLERLLQDILELGDCLKNYAQILDAKKQYKVAERCVEESEVADDPVIMKNRAAIYHRLGAIFMQEGDLKNAENYHKKGISIIEMLQKEEKIQEAERNLSASYLQLADTYREGGDLQSAIQFYEKSRRIRELYAKIADEIEVRRELMLVYNRLGDLKQKIKRFGEAKKYYELALNLANMLVEEARTIDAKRDRAICYNRLADLAQEEDNLAVAITYAKNFVEDCEEIAKEMDVLKTRRDLYISYQKYGEILQSVGRKDDARTYYQRGHQLCEDLLKETCSASVYADLAVSYYRLSQVVLPLYRKMYLKKAIKIGRELCRNYPDIVLYREYLDIFLKMQNK